MKMFHRLPTRIQFAVVMVVLNMIIFTLFRAVFWMVFRSTGSEVSGSELLRALYLGFKFDLRLSLLVCLPVLALSWIPFLNFVRSSLAKRIWLVYLVVMEAFIILMYFFDFGHYDYLHERLNASSIEHILPLSIALKMLWETYPVIPGILALLLFAFAFGWGLNRFLFQRLKPGSKPFGKRLKVAISAVALICLGIGIHGKLSQYPLRWSEAYFSTNPFVSALSLNPVLFLVDTLEFRKVRFNEDEARKYYPLMADLLEVDHPDPETLDFSRHVQPEKKLPGRPNIVLILCESLSSFKVGALGNKTNPTPHFDAIARDSLFFTNFFVTREPTARAIFTSMFGIPDIHTPTSASRDPLIVRQYTIVNALEGYKKMYFLGGSANWGNIRGILAHNIDGLEIHEEGNYSTLPDDAWGISDYHLVEEANQVFRVQDKPFFALIHTAGNHRPYTIPKDRGDFEVLQVDEQKLKENGFVSSKDYNAMRFQDYSLGHFFKLAGKEDYYRKTIFCIFGDHGEVGNGQIPWDKLRLTDHHVPFVIYAPGYFSKGRVIDTTGSLVDTLPTVLGLAGVPYLNKTLGRDLLAERPKEKHIAYVDSHSRGILNDEFFLLIDHQGVQRLYRYRSDAPLVDVKDQHPNVAGEMAQLFEAIRETSKYLLFHNRPGNLPVPSKQ
jgi:phosphoglycerol transferase MdoB-like AlkP superfamily enzyme